MKTLLPWRPLQPFVIAIKTGDVKGLVMAVRNNEAAAKKLGVHAIAQMMANPSDANRRQLAAATKSWQGISLRRLMQSFIRRQRRSDKQRHISRCYKSAHRVAPDVLSA